MNYQITPMNNHETGAEIRGIDLAQPVSDSIRAVLNNAFAQYAVLVFREQKLSPTQFVEAGGIFGEIMRHHRRTAEIAGYPMVSEVKNVPVAPGKYLIQGESFHTDHTNDPVPPKATALHAVSLPSRGGDTQFVNVHHAYDDLSDDMKRRIEGLKAVHVYQSKYSPREIRPLDADSLKHLPPPAIHRLVRIHPETGRKFLYMNPVRMESIQGMPDDEAQALIAELMAHATQLKYEYRHKWLYGDMVIWDNRSVMHQANADYDMSEVRHLIRILVKGALHPSEMADNASSVVEATA
jgi:taurine dioxygenase